MVYIYLKGGQVLKLPGMAQVKVKRGVIETVNYKGPSLEYLDLNEIAAVVNTSEGGT
jgi:hypothetical protein